MKAKSWELMAQKRKFNHEAIFCLNRRYRELLEHADQKDVMNANTSGIDPAYRNVIDTLKHMKYNRNSIMELIDLLTDEDFMKVYKGVIGLISFGDTLINNQNEEEFIGSGVIPKLVQLVWWRDHPFLQLRSLELLSNIVRKITPNNLRVFCNPTTIPFTIFSDSLLSPEAIFSSIVTFLQVLNNRNNFLQASDDNLHFLIRINELISCSNENILTLRMACRLLNQLKVHFWINRRQFANEYYRIRLKILQVYKKKQLMSDICRQIRQIDDKDRIKILINGINEYTPEVREVADYIKELINIPFAIDLVESGYLFSSFFYTIINIKESKTILPREELLNRTEALLFKQFSLSSRERGYSWRIAIQGLSILRNLLYSTEKDEQLLTIILKREKLFQQIGAFFAVAEKKLLHQLNTIVRCLVSRSYKSECLNLLLKFELLNKYFKHCNDFDQLTAKGALKDMQWRLEELKKKDMVCYQKIRKEVVTQENYKVINLIKSSTYLSRMEPIMNFYSALKEEGIVPTSQTIPQPPKSLQPQRIDLSIGEPLEFSDDQSVENDRAQLIRIPLEDEIIDVDGIINILDE